MRNRIMSLILLFALVFTVITPVMSFAQDEIVIGKYKVNGKHMIGNDGEYLLSINFSGENVTPDDVISFELPMKIEIEENEFFSAEYTEENNSFLLKLTPKDIYKTVNGKIEGNRIVQSGEVIAPIKVGNHIIDTQLEGPTGNPSGERESIYKSGQKLDDTKIQWDINIKQTGDLGKVTLRDLLGEGHKVLPNSFNIVVRSDKDQTVHSGALTSSEIISYNNKNFIWGFEIDEELTEFSMVIDMNNLKENEYLSILYNTEITNSNHSFFENSFQLDGSEKKNTVVKVESNSSFDGEKPEPTEPEPENPDPGNPEPTDPNLPQVGEEFNILAIGLLAVGLFQLIRSER